MPIRCVVTKRQTERELIPVLKQSIHIYEFKGKPKSNVKTLEIRKASLVSSYYDLNVPCCAKFNFILKYKGMLFVIPRWTAKTKENFMEMGKLLMRG